MKNRTPSELQHWIKTKPVLWKCTSRKYKWDPQRRILSRADLPAQKKQKEPSNYITLKDSIYL